MSSPNSPNSPKPNAAQLLTRIQAAKYLGISRASIDRYRKDSAIGLPYIQIGRLIKYRKADLDLWLANRVSNSPQVISKQA